MHEIVILGAGYAGLTAATSLIGRTRRARRTCRVRITVVDGSDHFTERLRLHQLATGQQLIERPFSQLLTGPGITLVTATAVEINTSTRTIQLDDGRTLPYQTLVYALGSQADTAAVPGAAKHAHTIDSASEAEGLAHRLRELDSPHPTDPRSATGTKRPADTHHSNEPANAAHPASGIHPPDNARPTDNIQSTNDIQPTDNIQSTNDIQPTDNIQSTNDAQPTDNIQSTNDAQPTDDRIRGTVAVCGAGLTGIETATEIASRYPRLAVILIGHRVPGDTMTPKARTRLTEALHRLGIRVISGSTVIRVRPREIELAPAADLTTRPDPARGTANMDNADPTSNAINMEKAKPEADAINMDKAKRACDAVNMKASNPALDAVNMDAHDPAGEAINRDAPDPTRNAVNMDAAESTRNAVGTVKTTV